MKVANVVQKALVLAVALTGCLDNELDPDDVAAAAGGKRSFIAQTSDFAEYASWMTSVQELSDDHGGVIGTSTVYVSEPPDADDHTFAVGAMLVKTMQPVGAAELTVHAMSKRGSTFNREGARGWEYFELLLDKTGKPFILWRGEKPPTGESYQQLLVANERTERGIEGDCNGCHADGRDGMLGDQILELLGTP